MAKRTLDQLFGAMHLCLAVGLLDPWEDAEFILGSLHVARRAKQVAIGDGIRRRSLGLDSFKDQQMKSRFRFTKGEIRELMDALESLELSIGCSRATRASREKKR